MNIKVTQDDIDKGIRAECGKCPIALAIRRQIPDLTDVIVGYAVTGYISKDGQFKVYQIPYEAQWFMARFDQCKVVEPFEFELS